MKDYLWQLHFSDGSSHEHSHNSGNSASLLDEYQRHCHRVLDDNKRLGFYHLLVNLECYSDLGFISISTV